VSVEVAHVDANPGSERFESAISNSVEKSKPIITELKNQSINFSVSVLIDDDEITCDRGVVVDKIIEKIEDRIPVDYVCYESELGSLLGNLEPLLSKETMDSINGYISDNGHIACSHDILIWYCLRLGLINGYEDLTRQVSSRAQNGGAHFIADRNISVLKRGVSKHEQWATEYLLESFPPEVASACSKLFYELN